jgi:hypothetical protein
MNGAGFQVSGSDAVRVGAQRVAGLNETAGGVHGERRCIGTTLAVPPLLFPLRGKGVGVNAQLTEPGGSLQPKRPFDTVCRTRYIFPVLPSFLEQGLAMSWGIVFAVIVIALGLATISFVYTWKQLQKEHRR